VDRGGTARLRLAWAMNNRAISPKGSAYVYVIGHEKREKCNSIVRIRLVLLLAQGGHLRHRSNRDSYLVVQQTCE